MSCFLFSHARIGLLIEPGRETEKIIIVSFWQIPRWSTLRETSVLASRQRVEFSPQMNFAPPTNCRPVAEAQKIWSGK